MDTQASLQSPAQAPQDAASEQPSSSRPRPRDRRIVPLSRLPRDIPLAINGRYLAHDEPGRARIARGIVEAIADRVDDDGVLHWRGLRLRPRLFAPSGARIAAPKSLPVHTSAIGGLAWEQFLLPLLARDGVLLNPDGNASWGAGPQVVYAPDARVEAASNVGLLAGGRWVRAMRRATGKGSGIVVTDTVAAARDLQRHAGIPRTHLHLAVPGADHARAASVQPLPPGIEALARGRGYFLMCVEGVAPSDLACALQAHARFLGTHPNGPVLLFAGTPKRDAVRALAERPQGTVHVDALDEDLRLSLLRKARALVYAAAREASRLPLVEAMTLGCPVIVADTPAARETCMDACLPFQRGESSSLEDAMDALLAYPRQTAAMIAAGRKRAAGLTWDACLDRLLDAVVKVAPGSRQRA